MANDAGIEARNVAGAITEMRIDELISNLAIGIARGQIALDQACMEIAQFMSTAQVAFGKRAGADEPDLLSLIELGFTPNFYQFVDTILEVRVAVSSKFEEKRETDVSDTRFQENEYQQQSQYEQQQQNSYGGWGYSAGGGWSWGGWGYGASGYGYSGSASSRYAGSSSAKSKNLMLTTVDAKYASTYNFAVEAASIVKTKIVPVPPPAVFEEVVRAKIQERRDWEQHMRWTDQARGILSSVSGSIPPILSLTTTEPTNRQITATVNEDNKEKVTKLQNDLSALEENYNQLNTNHWSVIRSVSDRQAADTALAGAVNKTTDLADLFKTTELGVDAEALDGLLNGLNNDLASFQKRIAEMLARVSPPAQTPAA